MPVGFVINVKRTVHRHDSPGNIRTHDDARTGRCTTVRRVDRRAKHSHQHLARSRQVHEAMVQITCSNPVDHKHINVLLLADSSLDQACHGIIRALVENKTTLTIILNNTREKRDYGPRRGVRKLGSKLGVGETKAPIVLGTSSTAQADAHRHSDWSSGVFEGGIAQPPPLRTFVKPAERSVSSAWPARTPLWQYVTTGRLRSPQTSDFTCSTATRNIQHQQKVAVATHRNASHKRVSYIRHSAGRVGRYLFDQGLIVLHGNAVSTRHVALTPFLSSANVEDQRARPAAPCERKTHVSLFECFPHVFPEPVLVKR